MNDWKSFEKTFLADIAPIYAEHEQRFDKIGLHGRKHVVRSLLFAEAMGHYYTKEHQQTIDFYGIRIAIAFHDAAREGNGYDLWEKESAELCYQYLRAAGKDEVYSRNIAQCISEKQQKQFLNLMGQIVYDADVLEIMRLFTKDAAGWELFRKKELCFLSEKDLLEGQLRQKDILNREQFIREAWTFIYETERNLRISETSDFFKNYLEYLEKYKVKWPLLYAYCRK